MAKSEQANAYAGRPSVCRNCGALVGAGETACGVCGTPVAARHDENARRNAPTYDPETIRFARAVLSRPATFTFVFLTFNVFIFLLMHFWGADSENDAVASRALLLFGAKYNSLINRGEWWRLVTPVFIHIGWLHLVVNMYSLFMLGPYVERLYGAARFVFFWVATGIAGVAASYFASRVGGRPGVLGQFLFRGGDGPSAGASGALFGLVGVLFVFGIKFRHELPDGFKRAFGLGMLPTILINLFIGYTIPFIDNAAHLGGLAAGMLLATFVGYKRPGERGSVAFTWHALQIVSLALVIVGFGEVARHFDAERRMVRPAVVGQITPQAQKYADAINAADQAFSYALGTGDASGIDRAVAALDAAPRLDDQAAGLRDELKELLQRARTLAPLARNRERTVRDGMELKRIDADKEDWNRRYVQWAENEEGVYGPLLDKAEEPPSQPKPAAETKNDVRP